MENNNTQTKQNYIHRINNVILYIRDHLQDDLSVSKLAEIACFSPYHFHRIFTAVVGETISNYINRIRIEKAATMLLSEPEMKLSSVAYDLGYKSMSNFSRCFKKCYAISPSKYCELASQKDSKICKPNSKNGQEKIDFERYICNVEQLLNFIKMNAKIEVRECPDYQVAYVMHKGSYSQVKKSFDKLMKWAGPKGLLTPEAKVFSVYLDDPKITAESDLRTLACIEVDDSVEIQGEISKTTISKGKYIVGSYSLLPEEFTNSWHSICVWAMENGYTLRNSDFYEQYFQTPETHPEGKFVVDICIPVE